MRENRNGFLWKALLAILIIHTAGCSSSHRLMVSEKLPKEFVEEQLDFAADQYTYFMQNVAEDKIPRSIDKKSGEIEYCGRRDWTLGFYPGTLWLLYEYSGNPIFRKEAERKLAILEPVKKYKGSHDLGFMMYNSFGNGYRITKNDAYKQVLLEAAESLSSRFNDRVGVIKSWDFMKGDFPVIIDNLMNLELLTWASQNGGREKWMKEAVSHAEKTMTNHFRPDNSSWHVVLYDEETGAVLKKKTHQGYSDESSWARGQSWGLYGYTMLYRETKDSTFLQQAEKVAHLIVNHPNLPKDEVPYWDFEDPKIPNTFRDVSAGAILASGLLELSQYTTDQKKEMKYREVAIQIIKSLSTPEYRFQYKEGQGFLLKHSVGNLRKDSEVDVPLNYADYYYVEALLRYKNWFLEKDKK